MAFLKTATAVVQRPHVSRREWAKIRTAGKPGQPRLVSSGARTASSKDAQVPDNLVQRASEFLGSQFSPDKYLLTHATIVASVDVYTPSGEEGKTGSSLMNGFRVNRKYPNYRIKPASDKFINNNCFIPGTSITMADGTVKPIEDIRVGDSVLTHQGRARQVIETFCHDVDGELLEIKVRGSNERLFVTPEHPFFAFRPNTECAACGGSITRKHRTVSHLLGKHYCSKECYYQHKVPNAELLHDKVGEFVEASGLTINDFASMPVIRGEQDVGLTLGQARLVGLFAAEGYYELDSHNDNERVGVCWAFHEDERETLAKTVCDLMWSEFGVECVVRPHRDDRGIHVTTKTHRKAVAFFSRYVFGECASDKHLHGDILTAPVAVQTEILRGWFEGDGSAFDTGTGRKEPGDFRLTGVSASQSLANQMQMLLHRQGVASRTHHNVSEGRRRVVVDGVVRVMSDPTKECHSWVVSCGAGYISDLVQNTVYADAYEAAAGVRGGFQQPPALRFLNGYCIQMFTGIDPVEYRGPVYNFETEEDHSYIAGGVAVHNCDAWSRPVLLKAFQTFIGGHNFVDHVQVESLSKGRIIDAIARDIGESVYVDILIATDRKHTDLVKAIESEKMGTLSMGCTVDNTTCTKCGHVAADETEMCPHIKFEKGNTFFDEQGRQHRVAELCGHEELEPTGGVTFIEASWVEIPAFTGAVLRNVLEAVPAQIERQAAEVLASTPPQWDMDAQLKAAARRQGEVVGTVKTGVPTSLRMDDGVTVNTSIGPIGEDQFLAGWDDNGMVAQWEEEEEEEATTEETTEEAGPFDDMIDQLTRHVTDKVKKRVEDQMKEEDLSNEDPMAPNDTIQHEANARVASVYRQGLGILLRTASSDAALMNGVAQLNNSAGMSIPVPIYRAALSAGAASKYASAERYLNACRKFLGRQLVTASEARTLIRFGKLLSRWDITRQGSRQNEGETR